MTVEIGVILPTSTPDPQSPILGDVQASARRAEELGLDSVWSTDHLVASGPMVDATVVLATAAAVTERITIGYNVLLLSLRPAAWVAKQIAGLQYVSSGGLVVGVGTGNPVHGDAVWRAAGLSYRNRGRRTDDALRLLPSLVTGQTTELPEGVAVRLAPGTAMPPVLVAGHSTRAKARAARVGDGWVAIGLAPAEVAANLRELAADFGPARATRDRRRASAKRRPWPREGRARRLRGGRDRTRHPSPQRGPAARLRVRRTGAVLAGAEGVGEVLERP
jgi:alkanesulfonate monooxygenase SsuD/methylene tetrahydromethanopterin reductase-like flavin-dependent oxidoreductase (luciferase family)